MTPLIQTFTKTLQPCSGCGTQGAASIWANVPVSTNPNMKQYLLQIVVEAEKASEAMAKGEGIGEVISQGLRPQGQTQTPMIQAGRAPGAQTMAERASQ